MRKVLGLFVVVALMLGVMTAPAAAVPVSDLTALARYFPVDAPLYIGVRSDDAFFNSLQDVVDTVGAALPAEMAAELPSIEAALDEFAASAPGGTTFEESFRSWLGDTIALGAPNVEGMSDDDESQLILVFESTDIEAADAFWTEAMEAEDDYTRSGEAPVIIYTPNDEDDGQPYIYLTEDAVIVSSVDANPLTREARLSANANFEAALARLPGDDYNMIAYLDVPLIAASNPDEFEFGTEQDAMAMALIQQIGQVGVGFTIVDDRALTIDIATEPFGDAGATIDPQFADHVPANTPLVIHGTNLAELYRSAVESARESALEAGTSEAEINEQLAQLEFAVRGFTGQDLEDILSWMTGDYILALSLSPAAQDASNMFGFLAAFPAEFGLIIDASADPEAAQTFASGISGTIAQFAGEELVVTTEEIGDATVTVLTITTEDMPFPIELILGADDEVLFVGTRRMAETAFTLEGGLIADPDFAEAWSYALTDVNYLLYLAGAPLAPLSVLASGGEDAEMQQEAARAVLNLLSSSSISTQITEDATLTRMVLTLGE